MKLIIAGGRNINISSLVVSSIIPSMGLFPYEIVSGTARGVDQVGEEVAEINELELKKFPADWDQFGKAAGHIRNKEMAVYADCLLLIWDGESKGSNNMKQNMVKLGKPIYEVILKTSNVIDDDDL